MDLFKYTLHIQEIETFTTLKAKEAFIREMVSRLPSLRKLDSIEALRYTYQCAMKCMGVFANVHKLPNVVRRAIEATENFLLQRYAANNISYEIFSETFQFTKSAYMNTGSFDYIKGLAGVVQDNPVKFDIRFNLTPYRVYTHLKTTKLDMPTACPILKYPLYCKYAIHQIEVIKLNMPNRRYTIIEDILDQLYTSLNNNSDEELNAYANSLTQITSDLNKTALIMAKRLTKSS